MLRPKNLLIIGFAQYILYVYIIKELVREPSLDIFLFTLLSLDTMLIAAGGYIINDIIDFEADVLNKPHNVYFKSGENKQEGWWYYIIVLIMGLCLALYIAIKIQNLPLVGIYPVACVLLFAYSYKFKNTVLTGNVFVSIFVAMVSGIVFFAERHAISGIQDISLKNRIVEILVVYMIFSFLINLIREIIKDVEDIVGDKSTGYMTFPIKYGSSTAVKLSLFLIVITILLVIIWLFYSSIPMDLRIKSFFTLFIIMPLIVIIQILAKSNTKKNFSKISRILKLIMVAGLAGLVLISSNLN